MKYFRHMIALGLSALVLTALMTGCGSKSNKTAEFHKDTLTDGIVFETENGQKVRIQIDRKYELTGTSPFLVTLDGELQSQGNFIDLHTYRQYVESLQEDPRADIVKQDCVKDGNEFIFWYYDDTDYNVAVHVGDTDTGILLTNHVSGLSANDVFESMVISAE